LHSRSWKPALLAGSALGIILLALLGYLAVSGRFGDSGRRQGPALELEDFLKVYWQKPIPLQGPPPPGYTKIEGSLKPEDCGTCHAPQYSDWKQSFHGKAMGAGPWGQIVDLTHDHPRDAVFCMTCHAPLSEQFPLINQKDAQGRYLQNPTFDPGLQRQGIVCAACHVRSHERFGPPRSDTSPAYPESMPNHGGVKRTPHFERSEFCKDCHQLDPKDTTLLNGKPLLDTYREWQNSTWGQAGASCQQCHMPGRRHQWRGIHDAEWVKSGVRMDIQVEERPPASKDALAIVVRVANAAVGHKFPTYVTPKVFVRAELLDKASQRLSGTRKESVIGWDARHEAGSWKEYFDTRIPAGETYSARFRWKVPAEARTVRVWMEIHPDHFYHEYFYPAYLKRKGISPEARKLIETALAESGRSRYTLFEEKLALGGK
jgi:hypothetical protein